MISSISRLRNHKAKYRFCLMVAIPGFEHVSDEPEESLVVDFLREYGQEDFMLEAAEAVADVALDEPYGASPGVVDFA